MDARVQEIALRVVRLLDGRIAGQGDDPLADSERRLHCQAIRAALTKTYGEAEPFDVIAEDRLSHVCSVFGLGELEEHALACAFAAEVDDAVATAYDVLAGESGDGHPTVGIVLELAEVSTGSAASAALVDADGPLRRNHLVAFRGTGTRLRRRVHAADRLVAHLLGSDRPDPLVEALGVDTTPLTGDDSRRIARAIEFGAPLVWARASLVTGGCAVAAGAFRELGLDALTVDIAHVPPSTALSDALELAAREAGLTGRGLVVAGLDDGPGASEHPGQRGMAEAARVLETAAVPVVVVSALRWRSGWTRHVPLLVDVTEPDAAQRAEVWSRTTGRAADEVAAVAQNRISAEDILAAARYAQLLAASRGEQVSPALLAEAARTVEAGRQSSSIMDIAPRPLLQLSDLVLNPSVQGDIARVVRWGRAHRGLARDHRDIWGKAGKGTGLAVLFTGSPGTGKTLAAQVVADELGLELMQVNLSAIVDKYIGETEKNLERVFAAAEARNVVLFFDEADALFGSRSDVKDARDRYANQEVAYLLQRIEHFSGISIMATNYRGNMDPAFVRRIQLIVSFPDPDLESRRRLWRDHLATADTVDPDDPIDADVLAGMGELTGGDIRNIALGAIYDSVSAAEPLGMRHVREATAREFRKLRRRGVTG